jgi:hypothetical protein
MRPLLVVLPPPVLDDHTHFFQAAKDLFVQAFIPELAELQV